MGVINDDDDALVYSTNPKVGATNQTFTMSSGAFASSTASQNYYMQFPVGFSVASATLNVLD